MNRIVIAMMGCLLVAVSFAEDIERTVDASADGHVKISNVAGSVSVEGWNRKLVEVTGTLGRGVKELIVERDGDKVLIKVKLPKNSHHGTRADLKIKLPKNSSLNIGTVSADVGVREVTGYQSLHTVSGDIETASTGADLAVESVSGDIEVSGNRRDGDVSVASVSGDVSVVKVAGEIDLVSVSGDVTVGEGSFDRSELETVNGDIEFHSELRKGGRLSIDTVNGDVDVEFAGDVSGRFDIDTFNGDIDNCFGPKAERTSKYAPGLELEFTKGSGKGRVKISTLNGDVDICN